MPTGYTEGILNGKINTFPEFAKTCMRAFGATIHLRDDSLDKEYEPRIPSDYYLSSIKECEENILKFENLSDDELSSQILLDLNNNKKYYERSIKEKKENLKKLNSMLGEAMKFVPPTEDHVGIKDYMIDQIEQTIKHDCDVYYAQKGLKDIIKQIKNFNIKEIRSSRLKDYKLDLENSRTRYNQEIERCDDANRWAYNLLKSIEK